MESSYSQYSPHLIQVILKEYKKGVRGQGFQALANKYNIKGGAKLIKCWHEKWDGSENSLKKRSGGDRRSILTPQEKKRHIGDFVTKKSKIEAVNYREVSANVEKKTGRTPSPRTVRRWKKS